MKRTYPLLVSLFFLLILSVSNAETVRITVGNAPLQLGSRNPQVLTCLPLNTTLEKGITDNGFYEVVYLGHRGYVYSSYTDKNLLPNVIINASENPQDPSLIAGKMVKCGIDINSDGKQDLGYLLYTPKDTNQKLPVIIFIHGAGEVGTNLDRLLRPNCLPKRLNQQAISLNAIVIMPQYPNKNMKLNSFVPAIIQQVGSEYNIDTNKISVMGFSLGGQKACEIVGNDPSRYSALIVMSGVSSSVYPEKLVGLPVRFFAGTLEQTKIEEGSKYCKKINEKGGKASFEILKGGHSEIPDAVLLKTNALEWILSQTR